MSQEPTLRDHARGAVRDEVSKQAWTLFAKQGYEATTIDQIAEAAGMSRRTFFRYFEGKDHLVLAQLGQSTQQIAEALRARPADETPWTALRGAFQYVTNLQETHADKSRPLQLMLRDEPALRTTMETRRRLWFEVLEPLIAQRLPKRPGQGTDLRAAALTRSAIACLETAQAAWAADVTSSLSALLDEAMGAVSPL